jgi:hypothetical protein
MKNSHYGVSYGFVSEYLNGPVFAPVVLRCALVRPRLIQRPQTANFLAETSVGSRVFLLTATHHWANENDAHFRVTLKTATSHYLEI